ncbi:MAG: glycoside hydrolase family protein [Anaeromyxobacter sp.]
MSYGFRSQADLDALTPEVGWWYNWSHRPDATLSGAEFVPMVWGAIQPADVATIEAGIPQEARFLLGFNEPNFKHQANLTAAEAAALWPLLERIADDRGLELVAPAVNYCGPADACWDTNPFSWLDDFFEACDARGGCRVDYVAGHWYSCYGGALSGFLRDLHAHARGRKVWLTEFACAEVADVSLPRQQAYMEDAVAILEADPMVFRYAWFIGRQAPANPGWPIDLLGADGQLTPLGEAYVGLPGP